jgi:hypothetical protein
MDGFRTVRQTGVSISGGDRVTVTTLTRGTKTVPAVTSV